MHFDPYWGMEDKMGGGRSIAEERIEIPPIIDRMGGIYDMQLQALSMLSEIELIVGGMKNDPPANEKAPPEESLNARVTTIRHRADELHFRLFTLKTLLVGRNGNQELGA